MNDVKLTFEMRIASRRDINNLNDCVAAKFPAES